MKAKGSTLFIAYGTPEHGGETAPAPRRACALMANMKRHENVMMTCLVEVLTIKHSIIAAIFFKSTKFVDLKKKSLHLMTSADNWRNIHF